MALSGLLATNLLFTVFVVALPEVPKSLHATSAATTWVVTGPLLAYGVVAPLVGKAGDLFGHRRLFMIGIMAETMAAAAVGHWRPTSACSSRPASSAGWSVRRSARRRWRS